ncbi:50S ribosomal protein L17 [Geodia barretti]|uniref:Large ribosomal subunit protein bL17m n=1 Tax=Geodia barretti TaxID=519541 RepID=A0AA35R5E7_GEOBA|nr:50S ribosomal protein L17 [Geodia barretti]
MRHRIAHRKLGRTTEHRLATLRNQAQMLLRHERIDTTLAKAKELRPFVERLITVAKRGLADGADTTRALHARRLVARDLADKKVASKLFDTIAPRFAERPGGYTRVLHLGRRKSDSAEIAQIEFVGSEFDPSTDKSGNVVEEKTATQKGVGGRLRAVAKRIGSQTDREEAK